LGYFLTDDDDALTGRAFAVNPDPIGLRSDGTKDSNVPEAVARTVDKPKPVEPSPNAAKASYIPRQRLQHGNRISLTVSGKLTSRSCWYVDSTLWNVKSYIIYVKSYSFCYMV
jgi:hypothetical protein